MRLQGTELRFVLAFIAVFAAFIHFLLSLNVKCEKRRGRKGQKLDKKFAKSKKEIK